MISLGDPHTRLELMHLLFVIVGETSLLEREAAHPAEKRRELHLLHREYTQRRDIFG